MHPFTQTSSRTNASIHVDIQQDYHMHPTALAHVTTETCNHTNIQPRRHVSTQTYSHRDMYPHKHTDTQTYRHTDTLVGLQSCRSPTWISKGLPITLSPCFITSTLYMPLLFGWKEEIPGWVWCGVVWGGVV